MSKLDAVRALREARFAQEQARAGKPASRVAPQPAKATQPAKQTKASRPTAVVETGDTDGEALCGHRNMGGKTCTRERGHAAKNHRYS